MEWGMGRGIQGSKWFEIRSIRGIRGNSVRHRLTYRDNPLAPASLQFPLSCARNSEKT